MHEYALPELNFMLEEILNTVKHYDVQHILTDTTKSRVTLDNEVYAQVMNKLALLLATTRLKKFARLATTELSRETIAQSAAELVKEKIQYQAFDNRAVAMAWLTS
ncbi:hypothetical protein [Pontibacter litorisediminis]|uniref:hypothetical protein n=1 Tax=Pontibacter litorisediminis TaxID=1846260 RepID=UPI0023ED0A5C|nr:hypothetical protein [Pontibacter litorisediminis]